MAFDQLMAQVLTLDIEVTRTGANVRHIGAAYRGNTFAWAGAKQIHLALADLDTFGRDAQYVLGHNPRPLQLQAPSNQKAHATDDILFAVE